MNVTAVAGIIDRARDEENVTQEALHAPLFCALFLPWFWNKSHRFNERLEVPIEVRILF